MEISNARIFGKEGRYSILLNSGLIQRIRAEDKVKTGRAPGTIDIGGALVIPGLVNSHDHLDFNLFPRLGQGPYKSYIEWGADIQSVHREEIKAVLQVPRQLRIQWGMYRNLLAGVTTVVHHGPRLTEASPLINIPGHIQSIHSIARDPFWRLRLNRISKRNEILAIHIGEGTDRVAAAEVDRCVAGNWLKRNMIAIHGIGMDPKKAGAWRALVWCPVANYFLYGQTADIISLKQKTQILLGTDSTLTGDWNIWDHLRVARAGNQLTDEELFASITVNAATAWKLERTGRIETGYWGDLVIINQAEEKCRYDSLFQTNPKDLLMVLVRGDLLVADAGWIGERMDKTVFGKGYSLVYLDGVAKYVKGDLPGLSGHIRQFYPGMELPFAFKPASTVLPRPLILNTSR